MSEEQEACVCAICGAEEELHPWAEQRLCATCLTVIELGSGYPERVRKAWNYCRSDAISAGTGGSSGGELLPEVLEGKRYRTVDRERNKWYLSVSEVDGHPVEVFASTAFDRDHELQSRISNLTTITRLISLILRHIFLNERLTLESCLKQIKRSSRQPNDLPDMLYGVLSRYEEKTPRADTEQKATSEP